MVALRIDIDGLSKGVDDLNSTDTSMLMNDVGVPEGTSIKIPPATVTGYIESIVWVDSETSETNEEVLGVAEEHGTDVQSGDPYDELENLEEVLVQIYTKCPFMTLP